MDDYAGRVLADRYRLPLPPSDEYEFAETRAFDTYSGQEVLVRQVPLPEVVEAEVLDDSGAPVPRRASRTTRRPTDPAVRRAIEAAQAAAQIPDHPRLDQVFDVFAEGGSLWIVSEVVAALPLAALIAERPLSPYRAAEVASDVLTALRALHVHGWVHRNITVRTVLVCDDGRIMLTGLAAGAAEEALCGYDPVPEPLGAVEEEPPAPPQEPRHESRGHAAIEAARAAEDTGGGEVTDRGMELAPRPDGAAGTREPFPPGDARAARAGAIAAYRAGARAAAAARVSEEHRAALPGPRPDEPGTDAAPPGRIADPYGVAGQVRAPGAGAASGKEPVALWHGAVPRPAATRPTGEQGESQAARPNQQAPQTQQAPQAQQTSGLLPTGPQVGRNAPEFGPEEQLDPAFAPTQAFTPTQAPAPTQARNPAQAPAPTPLSKPTGRWDELQAPEPPRHKGPLTPLDAERARQARMTVVGAVTERWSPEQAGPVHENWQLAAPVGPATDLWALGALLFRAVQGHAPYPEDSTYELVQLVCAEPPAFAEECGPLRPVVESLLRQDPTERPDFEELRGWLRSLVRSAPEPEAGTQVVPTPPFEPRKLPVVRRRGELVRRKRRGAHKGAHKKGRTPKAPREQGTKRGRPEQYEQREQHRPRTPRAPYERHELQEQRAPQRERRPQREPKPPRELRQPRASRPPRQPRPQPPGRPPRRLGRLLLVLILLGLVAAVVYAMMFMPKSDPKGKDDGGRTGQAGSASSAPESQAPSDKPSPDKSEASKPPSSGKPETQSGAPDLPKGFVLRRDLEGFQLAVASGWDRHAKNGKGQVKYSGGKFELTVVPGRDTVEGTTGDPLEYQRENERELQPFRDSSWASSSGMRQVSVGDRISAEGQFTWFEGDNEVFVRNSAMLIDGRYHVVMIKGPESERDEVTRLFEQASATYRPKT